MKKNLFLISVFCITVSAVFAQNASPLPQMDAVVKQLAADIGRKLNEERAGKVALAQITFEDNISPLGSYWANQLTEELAQLPNKSFTILSDRPVGADWIIQGEIIEMPGIVRVFTRLVRAADRTIAASFHSDFEQNEYVADMLAGSGGSSPRVPRDTQEPDSWDNPVSVEPGESEQAPVMNRTFHSEGDEDFFLIVPDTDGRLVVETTGSLDTYMYLYEADTQNELRSNDDEGSGNNARIRHSVQAGKRYIAKVRPYDDDETGRYGFRVYLIAQTAIVPDEYESDNNSESAKEIVIGTPQQHTFTDGDDDDWVQFQVSQAGRYTIRTRGVRSNRLDTCIELFDADLDSIGEDDDGGQDYDSRLALRLESGRYYLKVWCLDNEPEDPYTISIEAN